MKFSTDSHLSYCTNIHPAESWESTSTVLRTHVLGVREQLRLSGNLAPADPFAIGLRLSAKAATELLAGDHLPRFRDWLAETNTYVFTINGFPYGNFHGTRVKERVFQPDWTDPERLRYTKDLFKILAFLSTPGISASVSTLPGSHKTFHADEKPILTHLIELASYLDHLSEKHGIDFHLGLEPEPLGHFENTAESLSFFERLHTAAPAASETIRRRIGLNYDACHFALEYDDARSSLDALHRDGVRISKIHLSSALALDPRDPAAIAAIRGFDEPVYFHQALLRSANGEIHRFPDLPDFFAALDQAALDLSGFEEMRVHFHIPIDADPAPPLRSTRGHLTDLLAWRRENPHACQHYEIETYTWAVLPPDLQRPVERQIAGEYAWVLAHA